MVIPMCSMAWVACHNLVATARRTRLTHGDVVIPASVACRCVPAATSPSASFSIAPTANANVVSSASTLTTTCHPMHQLDPWYTHWLRLLHSSDDGAGRVPRPFGAPGRPTCAPLDTQCTLRPHACRNVAKFICYVCATRAHWRPPCVCERARVWDTCTIHIRKTCALACYNHGCLLQHKCSVVVNCCARCFLVPSCFSRFLRNVGVQAGVFQTLLVPLDCSFFFLPPPTLCARACCSALFDWCGSVARSLLYCWRVRMCVYGMCIDSIRFCPMFLNRHVAHA